MIEAEVEFACGLDVDVSLRPIEIKDQTGQVITLVMSPLLDRPSDSFKAYEMKNLLMDLCCSNTAI